MLAILVLFMTSACEKILPDGPNEYRAEKKYRIDNSLSFTITTVVDYRCPEDVICIWAGDVEMNFRFTHNLTARDTLIYLWSGRNNPFTLYDYTFTINDVTPYRRIDQNPDIEDYVINMTID